MVTHGFCRLMRLCVALGLAATARVEAGDWSGTAAVAFTGTSTLHDFGGTLTGAPVRCTSSGTGTSMTWAASGEMNVTNLSTSNSGRDAKMMTMLSAATWPVIRASVPVDPLVPVGTTGCMVRVEIAGCTNQLPAAVSNWTVNADALAFDVTFRLSLKTFSLKPPSVLGMIRVADRVDVHCRIETQPATTKP